MIQEEQVYCVGCGRIISKESAGKVFRTGYYRCAMRIGLCERCMESGLESESAQDHSRDRDYMAVDPL